MSGDPVVGVRLPTELTDRVDLLVEKMKADPNMRAFGRISRSSTFRMAMVRGLASLEAKYAERPETTGQRNARIIECAPELLAALENLIGAFDFDLFELQIAKMNAEKVVKKVRGNQ